MLVSAQHRRPVGLSFKEAFLWYELIPSGECLLWPGPFGPRGYGCFNYRGHHIAHRVAYELAYEHPGELHVDHTCYNHACVNPQHLRAVTPKQNMENRSGPGRNNTSGVRGVTWNKRERKWKAQVSHHRKIHFVGTFGSLPEAEAAVVAKRLELFTHNDIDKESNGSVIQHVH